MSNTTQVQGRAVIFGATGGIGGAFVAALAERGWQVAAGSRSGAAVAGACSHFAFDLRDEASIAAAAASLRAAPPQLVIVATGVLTLPDGTGPEKTYRHIDGAAMAEALLLNTIGPALIAKHMLPLLPRDARGIFAALGARVGSIGDNRLGGWHSYRASKAALAMLIRNFAIELARTNPAALVVGLHPGTVATALSAPFAKPAGDRELFAPSEAAARLLSVLDRLTPADSGGIFDWQGSPIGP